MHPSNYLNHSETETRGYLRLDIPKLGPNSEDKPWVVPLSHPVSLDHIYLTIIDT